MILHHFCRRNPTITRFSPKTLILNQKSWKYPQNPGKYLKIQGFLRFPRDPCGALWTPVEHWKKGYREHFRTQVRARHCRASLLNYLKPQRVSTLTPAEERIRCPLPWEMFDQNHHLLDFGQEQELLEHVLHPQTVLKNRENWRSNLSIRSFCGSHSA